MNFLQFLRDLDLLRTVLFTLATFGAICGSLLGGEQVVIEHEIEILILEHKTVIVEGEIQRNVDTIRAWHTVCAPGAANPEHAAIDFADFGNYL